MLRLGLIQLNVLFIQIFLTPLILNMNLWLEYNTAAQKYPIGLLLFLFVFEFGIAVTLIYLGIMENKRNSLIGKK